MIVFLTKCDIEGHNYVTMYELFKAVDVCTECGKIRAIKYVTKNQPTGENKE